MIRMVAGVYGLTIKRGDGSTYVQGMGPESGPFSITPAEEERLVSMKVAEYVVDEEPKEPSEGMTAKQLREIGKEYGLTFGIGITKAVMVEAIKAAMNPADPADEDADDDAKDADEQSNGTEEEEADGEDTETEEEEAPADEDAPTFDAAEAVQ